ncbi:glycosyltransferase family 39 protein [Pirellulaceae bacterium SH449]
MTRADRAFLPALACIVALQAILLSCLLQHKSFTADECYELRNLALNPLTIAADGDGFPPLFRWLLSGVILVTGEPLARIFPMLTSLLGTLVIGWTGRKIAGAAGGLAGATFFAFSACQWEYAQQLRSYSLYILGIALMGATFFRLVQNATPSRWLGFVVSTSLALLTHYFAVLFAVVLWGILGWLTIKRSNKLSPKGFFIAAIGCGALSLPFLWALQVDLAYPPPPEVVNPVDLTSVAYLYLSLAQGWCVGPSSIELQSMPLQQALLQIGPWAIISFGAAFCLILSSILSEKKWEASVLLILLSITTLIAIGLSLTLGFSFVSRYLAGLIAPTALLVCLGCQRLCHPKAWLPLLILLAINGLSIANRNYNERYDRENYRLLIETILAQDSKPQILVLSHYISHAVRKTAPQGCDITPLAFYSDDPDDTVLWESLISSEQSSGAWLVTEWFPPHSPLADERNLRIEQLGAIHVARIGNTLELYRLGD